MSFFVYLLECRDKSLYCGWTNDLEKRVKEHNSGKASKYTKVRRPVKLVFFEESKTKSAAMKREFEIKSFSREKKLSLVALAQLNSLSLRNKKE